MFYLYVIVLIMWIIISIMNGIDKKAYKEFDWIMFSEIIWLTLLGIVTTLK